jgi:4-phospho-D-threonate 3-dehydrogenase / 4-phospho-D-erythronate 3-dehydrogenase
MTNEKPLIGITMGDPASIGPEIVIKGLAQQHLFHHHCVPFVIGDLRVLQTTRSTMKLTEVTFQPVDNPGDIQTRPGTIHVLDMCNADPSSFRPGEVSAISGKASAEYVLKAATLAMEKRIDAVVTGPINKESINLGGYHYAGHTELLAAFTKAQYVSMMLVSSKLRVLHVSTHLSLREACDAVKRARVLTVIQLAHTGTRMLGIDGPRIAVAGLNPHAGESGLFGTEEITEIIPAIEDARSLGLDVSGPWAGDTVFLQATQGKFDVVVAMYHDQGHIPMKLLGFDEGVNVSIGLPIIRTSVDHGTAFDIVGTGAANETSLLAALNVAVQMVKTRSRSSDAFWGETSVEGGE